MGELTKSMTLLRNEIVNCRRARREMQNELARQTKERRKQVSAMCAAFARDRAGAHLVWFGPAVSESRAAKIQKQQQPAEKTRPQHQDRPRESEEPAKAKTDAALRPSAPAKPEAPQQRPVVQPVPHEDRSPFAKPFSLHQKGALKALKSQGSKKH